MVDAIVRGKGFPASPKALGMPLIIGHRGVRAGFPENTLASFRAAVDAGADMVELDVTLTLDHQVVVIHDDTLERTTTGKGEVGAHTLSRIRDLDAGTWFHKKFAGEKVPLLEEALDTATLPRDFPVNIEIKKQKSRRLREILCKKAVEIAGRAKPGDCVLFSSFDPCALEDIRSISKKLYLGYITRKGFTGNTGKVLVDNHAVSWHPGHEHTREEDIQKARSLGILVIPYTVNQEACFEKLVKMGVDGVFTDDPKKIRGFLPAVLKPYH